MYLSYYKRPELMLLDKEACEQFVSEKKYKEYFFRDFYHANLDMFSGGAKDDFVAEMDDANKMDICSMVWSLIKGGAFAETVRHTYYVSKTFHKAMYKSFDKLMPMIHEKDVLRDIQEDCCFICNTWTMFLFSIPGDELQTRYLMITIDGALSFFSGFLIGDDGLTHSKSWSLVRLDDKDGIGDYGNDDIVFVESFFSFLLFKKYGNVDIEMVARNKTLRKSQILGEKVNNFMGIDVQVLDSRWFTTICRDEGFLVSGHFRLQPCKDENGEWTRKLIYINPYAKHGYHRLAPIVNIDN